MGLWSFIFAKYDITVTSFIFVDLKFRGLEIKNEFVNIYFRCFLMCSQTENRLCEQVFLDQH